MTCAESDLTLLQDQALGANCPTIARGILAIRYDPQEHKKKKGGGHSWQVWWSDKSVTWHPETDLTGIDHCHIRDAVIQPGKRIKMSGSRREDLLAAPLGAADELFPGQFFRRDLNGFGALNAVYNAMRLVGVQLPQSLYDEIHARGPFSSLESVIGLIHGPICQFSKPKGVGNAGLLVWIRAQSQGVYICEYGGRLAGHCVTWDAERKYVVDTDSRYPTPLASDGALDVTCMEKVYRVNLFLSKKRKAGSQPIRIPVVTPDTTSAELSFRQASGEFSSLHAVYNALVMQGVELPEAIYTELRGHGTHLTIETVAEFLSKGGLVQFSRPKGVIKSHLLVWLRGQTEGVYCVAFSDRCVTWHATPSGAYMVETDPLYPNTLPVTDALLSRLEMYKVYRVVACRPKKRKRT